MMNYEKAYKEALERARKELKQDLHESGVWALQRIFPELRESEDERIRLQLLDFLEHLHSQGKEMDFDVWSKADCANWILWLEKQKVNTEGDFARGYDCGYECCLNSHGAEWFEKQKEQNPINSYDIVPYIDDKIASLQDMWREEKVAFDWDDMHEMIEDVARHFYHKEQKSVDSSENNDKSEMSDVNGHLTGKILVEYGAHAKVRDGKRHCEMDWKEFQRLAHYFYELGKAEQKPVEIHIDNPNVQKFDPSIEVTTSDSSAGGKELLYVSNKSYNIGFRDGVNSVKPAEWSDTNELVFQDICKHLKEEGYSGWIVLLNALRNGEFQPKQEWSDEDEKMIDDIIRALPKMAEAEDNILPEILPSVARKYVERLKSLRPQPKQEWSEEDEAMRDNILRVLSCYVGNVECESNPSLSSSYFTYRREIGWLKSLRPSWKPSEEEVGCLERLIAFKNPEPEDINGCKSLLEQLTKLI